MKNEYDIEELLSTKGFDELSADEKEFVLNALDSEKAYNDLRQVIQSFREIKEDEVPEALREKTMAAFEQAFDAPKRNIITLDANKKNRNIIKPLVYILVAASVLVAVFLFLPQTEHSKNSQLAENKTELKKDSISPKSEAKSNTAEAKNAKTDLKAEPVAESVEVESEKEDAPEAPKLSKQSIEISEESAEQTLIAADKDPENAFSDAIDDSAFQEIAQDNFKSTVEEPQATAADLAAAPQPVQDSYVRMQEAERGNSAKSQSFKMPKNTANKDDDVLQIFKLRKLKTPHYVAY